MGLIIALKRVLLVLGRGTHAGPAILPSLSATSSLLNTHHQATTFDIVMTLDTSPSKVYVPT